MTAEDHAPKDFAIRIDAIGLTVHRDHMGITRDRDIHVLVLLAPVLELRQNALSFGGVGAPLHPAEPPADIAAGPLYPEKPCAVESVSSTLMFNHLILRDRDLRNHPLATPRWRFAVPNRPLDFCQ